MDHNIGGSVVVPVVEYIHHNLFTFGLPDVNVTVRFQPREEGEAVTMRRNVSLSAACVEAVEWRPAGPGGIVVFSGEELGILDGDGRFAYTAAPDLRTALGWALVTDGGRERCLLGVVDLDAAVAGLEEIIRGVDLDAPEAVVREVFFEAWMPALARVFVAKKTSRFGSGHCAPACDLWTVATRTVLGRPHPGFEYHY